MMKFWVYAAFLKATQVSLKSYNHLHFLLRHKRPFLKFILFHFKANAGTRIS